MAELEEEVKESAGLVMTQAQERRREMAEAMDKKKDTRKNIVSRQEEKKMEVHRLAHRQEPQIANSEAPQEILWKILDVKVPNI